MKIKLLIVAILSFLLSGCAELYMGTMLLMADKEELDRKPLTVSIVNYTNSKIVIDDSDDPKKTLPPATPTKPSQLRFEAMEEFKLVSLPRKVILMRYSYEIKSSYFKITISYADAQKEKFKIQLDYLSFNNKTKTIISFVENKESLPLKKLDRK